MNQAYEIPSFYLGVFPADIDMSVEATYMYHAVGIRAAVNVSGCNGVALINASAAVGPCIGILQNNPQQGEAAQVMNLGASKAVAGAAFAAGTLLMANSTGQLITATSTNFAIAQALQAAASAGDVVSVLIHNFGKQ